jgi:AcrR family transcriptional regulator
MAKTEKKAVRGGDDSLWDEVAALKRERILKEAASLFSERGYHGTTIDAIADRFSATKPFVYYHFSSKIDLLTEICERGTRETLEAAERAMELSRSPKERLDQFVREFTAVTLENQQYVTIYFREEINLPKTQADRINKMRKEIDRKLTKLLEEGMKSGDFKMQDPQMTCLVIAGMVSYAFAWYRKDGRLQTSEICDQMSGLVLNMVAA